MARRYELIFRVAKTTLFLIRENNINIFEPPCNVLFIMDKSWSFSVIWTEY